MLIWFRNVHQLSISRPEFSVTLTRWCQSFFPQVCRTHHRQTVSEVKDIAIMNTPKFNEWKTPESHGGRQVSFPIGEGNFSGVMLNIGKLWQYDKKSSCKVSMLTPETFHAWLQHGCSWLKLTTFMYKRSGFLWPKSLWKTGSLATGLPGWWCSQVIKSFWNPH